MTFSVRQTTGDPEVAQIHVAQLRNDSDLLVECVDGLDPPQSRADKWIVNVSTQIGCPVGCPFCDAGGGFRGNLSADEIFAQIDWILAQHPGAGTQCKKLKVHFARMGEPSLNDAVIEVLDGLPGRHPLPGLWACVATVAPRHREGWFGKLLEVKKRQYHSRFQLQFSVNSTDPTQRARLLPIPHWGLQEIDAYGRQFFRPGDRKILLNFALATDSIFDPEALIPIFDPEIFAIKLTPLNPTSRGEENGFATLLRSVKGATLDHAIERLQQHGFDVVVSIGDPREDEVGSNCGQAVRWYLQQTHRPDLFAAPAGS